MNRIQLSDLKLNEIWTAIRRTVLYGLYLVAALLLQNVIFGRISLFGARCMFLPALVVGVAMFEGGRTGGFFGLAAGIVCDLFFSSQRVLFTALFPLMGFFVGFLVDFFLNRRFFSYAVMAALGLLLAALAQLFPLLVYRGQSPLPLLWTAFLQTLWSLPFIFPVYHLCKIFPWRSEDHAPSPYQK